MTDLREEAVGSRALNRATLARQHLLERRKATVLQEVGHLVALQAQVPFNPYTGLHARLAGFRPEALAKAMLARKVCRMATLRSTIHLQAPADAVLLRWLAQPAVERSFNSNHRKGLGGTDPREVAEAGRRLLEADGPMTFEELGNALMPKFPGGKRLDLGMAVRTHVPLVQVTPRGVWGQSLAATHAPADSWLGVDFAEPDDRDAALDGLVLRYLAAHGPASVMDMQSWATATGLKPAFERLAPDLVAFTDAKGRALYDVPRGPRPDPDTPAPPRLMPEYDNLFLSHADRSRLLGDGERKALRYEGPGWQTLLVDGAIAGRWSVEDGPRGAILTAHTFRPLAPASREDVEAEALGLLRMLRPDEGHTVRFARLRRPP